MKKIKWFRKGKYLIAACLVLFIFLSSSLPAFASSHYYEGHTNDTISGVPYTWEINFDDGYFPRSTLFTHAPVFGDYGNGINSNLSSATYRAWTDTSGSSFYYCSIESDPAPLSNFNSLELPIDFEPIYYDSSGHFRGSVAYYDVISFNSIGSVPSPSFIDTVTLKLQDFSCWIDSEGNKGSEIVIYFPPVFDLEESLTMTNTVLSYSIYGSGSAVYNHDFSMPFLTDNCLYIDPSMFGHDDPGTYFYIHDLELEFSFAAPAGMFFSETFLYRIQTVYTFNPDLYDYSFASGMGPGNGNPALPLLDYTEWMGNAVSGILDLEIFPQFTLGGILMTLLAFVCVVWFLKLVAGG